MCIKLPGKCGIYINWHCTIFYWKLQSPRVCNHYFMKVQTIKNTEWHRARGKPKTWQTVARKKPHKSVVIQNLHERDVIWPRHEQNIQHVNLGMLSSGILQCVQSEQKSQERNAGLSCASWLYADASPLGCLDRETESNEVELDQNALMS